MLCDIAHAAVALESGQHNPQPSASPSKFGTCAARSTQSPFTVVAAHPARRAGHSRRSTSALRAPAPYRPCQQTSTRQVSTRYRGPGQMRPVSARRGELGAPAPLGMGAGWLCSTRSGGTGCSPTTRLSPRARWGRTAPRPRLRAWPNRTTARRGARRPLVPQLRPTHRSPARPRTSGGRVPPPSGVSGKVASRRTSNCRLLWSEGSWGRGR